MYKHLSNFHSLESKLGELIGQLTKNSFQSLKFKPEVIEN